MTRQALRLVLLLLEEFDDAGAAVELGLGGRVEVGAELREGGEFAELREVELGGAGDFLDRLRLRGGTDARHREARRKSRDGCPGRTGRFRGRSGRR